MKAYDEAVATLYQAPLAAFVSERKRLAAQLKADGDKEAAAQLSKLARPPVSAWAVNQLWWRERAAFEALLIAAGRVTVGDREASQTHRQALARLREVATKLLQESGNATTDATLRRITTTLSAVAATGGFAPDAPGALAADRDPPGFEALGFGGSAAGAAPPADDTAQDAKAAEQRRVQEAEQRRAEEAERERRLAERERLSALLRDARQLRESQQRDVTRLRSELETAEQGLEKTRALLVDLDNQLAKLAP